MLETLMRSIQPERMFKKLPFHMRRPFVSCLFALSIMGPVISLGLDYDIHNLREEKVVWFTDIRADTPIETIIERLKQEDRKRTDAINRDALVGAAALLVAIGSLPLANRLESEL